MQKSLKLSIVIPVYNSASWLLGTLDAIDISLKNSLWEEFEIIIVDDGSTDGIEEVLGGYEKLAFQLIKQQNLGRFLARKHGLANSTGTHILFIDSRVRIDSQSLNLAFEGCREFKAITAHINYSSETSILGLFWSSIEVLFWWRYWRNPKKSVINYVNFHSYPKGTTCLIIEIELARQAFRNFASKFTDLRNSSDDTELLDFVSKNAGILIDPGYSATYNPRTDFRAAMQHAYHRGIVFFDGHFSRNSALSRKLLLLLTFMITLSITVSVIPNALWVGVFILFAINLFIVWFLPILRWKRWLSLVIFLPFFAFFWSFGLFKGSYLWIVKGSQA